MWKFVVLCVLSAEIFPIGSERKLDMRPAVEVQRLRLDLLQNYDRLRRPVKDESAPTATTLFYDLQHVVSLDEKNQILTVKGILEMAWTDEHLTWNPDSYSGIAFLQLASEEIWIPDIHSMYNVKATNLYERSTPTMVFSNGSVKWSAPAMFDVPCTADYRHYPFDSHNCSILLISWNSVDNIQLRKMKQRPSSETKRVEGAEWRTTDVLHENVIYRAEYNTFYQVQVIIFLERTSRIYRYICVIPTVLSMMSLLAGFWLLPGDASRYLVGCSNVLVLSLLLQHLATTVPCGRIVPLLAQYSASCLCLSAVFVVVTVIANALLRCSSTAPVGLVRWARQTLHRHPCLFAFFEEDTIQDASADTERKKDWHVVSLLVDRIAFCCFIFIFAVLLGVLAAI